MKINRLLDDFDDQALRNYWDLNLKYITTKSLNETVGINNLFFSSAHRLNLVTSDYYKNSENYSTKNSEKFLNQSNLEIYESYNHQLCAIFTDHVMQWGNQDNWFKERSKFFEPQIFNKLNEEYENEYKKHPFSPPLAFFNLKVDCKDLLTLPILVESFYLKINNEELITLSKQLKAEFLLKTESLK